MKTALFISAMALAAGVAIGLLLQPDPTPSGGPVDASRDSAVGTASEAQPAATDGGEIAELKAILQQEIDARQRLEQRIADLSRRLETLDQQRLAVAAAADMRSTDSAAAGGQENAWFDQQALIDSGMDSGQAYDLKIFFEQMELERLRLRDRSIRENWEPEKLQAQTQLLQSREDDLKIQLGESAYDAYLYAAGRPNRVAVTSVLASAQAGQAGIQSGDHILRYDNERIYNWMDLRSATTSGNVSDTVTLEVERDGETLQFFIARGPLGIRMDSVSVAP